MQKKSIPELLSPVGNMDSMYAAINNGADAIYLGGKAFNARGSAQNFTDGELEAVIEYAGLRNIKVYVTINTLYKNNEIYNVLLLAQKMYNLGANAFILQDIGTASEIKKCFPDMPIHASTQMSVHSLEGVKYIEKQGFSRVILSRELSISEIEEINNNTNIETEVFVHGALCASYSGQCLMSSLIGGRSGNRGKCAQPCRLKYNLLKNGESIANNYLLSPKDIMTLEILEDIIDSGVTSLKIEGRMKSPEYVAVVTKAYREQLDRIKHGEASIDYETLKNVTQIFNRGGSSSTSYFKSYSGKDMMSDKTPKSTGLQVGTVVGYSESNYDKGKCLIDFSQPLVPGDGIEIWTAQEPHVGTNISKTISKGQTFEISIDGDIQEGDLVYKSYDKTLMDNAKKLYKTCSRQMDIKGHIEAKIGSALKLKVFHKGICITKESDVVEPAQNSPTTADKILKQLSKTGNTPFKIDYDSYDIDENIYISVSKLNELRRSVIEAFEEQLINSFKRESNKTSILQNVISSEPQHISKQKLTVQVKNTEQLSAILNKNVYRVYFDYSNSMIKDIHEIIKQCTKNDIELFISFSSISRNEKFLKNTILELEKLNIQGYMVSSYGQLEILESIKTDKKIVGNHNFNVFNNLSSSFFISKGIGVTLSQELNMNELRNMGGENCELIIYGRQILMTTHQCPAGIYDAGKSSNKHCRNRNNKDRYSLLDRKDAVFPIITDCDNCIAYILNSKTLSMYSKYEDIKDVNVEYLRLVFNMEEAEDVAETIKLYSEMLSGIPVDNQSEEATYGHFYRGVE